MDKNDLKKMFEEKGLETDGLDFEMLYDELFNIMDPNIELDPNSVDGKMERAIKDSKTPIELKSKLESIIKDEYKVLKKKGLTGKDSIGDYWLLFETRPYMRARSNYLDLLVELAMYKKAIEEAEDLLRLCEGDNLGIRYTLMHLYVYMEDEESALKLCKKFTEDEDYIEELPVEFAIPLAALYFKKADFKKAKKYLIEAQEVNENTIDFFEELNYGDIDIDMTMNMDSFIFNSLGQLEVMYIYNMYFYDLLQHFIMWACDFLDSKFN